MMSSRHVRCAVSVQRRLFASAGPRKSLLRKQRSSITRCNSAASSDVQASSARTPDREQSVRSDTIWRSEHDDCRCEQTAPTEHDYLWHVKRQYAAANRALICSGSSTAHRHQSLKIRTWRARFSRLENACECRTIFRLERPTDPAPKLNGLPAEKRTPVVCTTRCRVRQRRLGRCCSGSTAVGVQKVIRAAFTPLSSSSSKSQSVLTIRSGLVLF